MRRVLLAVTAVLALGAQASNVASQSTPPQPVTNTYRGPAASGAPRRVMIAQFGESVGAEGSGRACAEMAARILGARGLEVVSGNEAAGSDLEQLRQAESQGADVAVLGAVTQWTRREIETSDAWVTRRRREVFVAGAKWVESQVALKVRILQVPSGRLAYSVLAHWSAPWEGEPDEAAEKLLEAALADWFSTWSRR